jgi:LacI family transcriptional regulator
MASKPTIRDVAREAGVSIATVSYVLNRASGEGISDRVKERVHAAIRTLNYHRAAAAVSLARQRTRNIGVILYPVDSDVTNPFYSFVIQGVIREVMDRDYNLLFAYVDAKQGRSPELPKMIREANVVGVLFVGRIHPTMVLDIRNLGIEMVGIDHGLVIDGLSSVQIANRAGGAIAATHLLELGHERMVFVGLVPGVSSIASRHDGFRDAVAASVRRNHLDVVRCKSLSYHESHAHTRDLLKGDPRITAVFGANDEVAAGVMRAARELGRRIPDDLSVVGFDDIIMAQYTDPPLTTVGVPKEQLGRRAASLLVDTIDGKVGGMREDVVPVELVLRGSTAVATKAHEAGGDPRRAGTRSATRKAAPVVRRRR